jgi:hypothetical protein
LLSTPAWRSLDPLPVVTSPRDEDEPHDNGPDSHLGDRDVEHLFDANQPDEEEIQLIQ